MKEDRLTLKPQAVVAVARLGEFAPREALLQQLRAATNLFHRVEGIPAVLSVPSEAPSQAQVKVSLDVVKISVNYVLTAGSDVEVLQTTNPAGTAAISLTGNEVGNAIVGNEGQNTIVGGMGIFTVSPAWASTGS